MKFIKNKKEISITTAFEFIRAAEKYDLNVQSIKTLANTLEAIHLNKDQDILCALSQIVIQRNASNTDFELISSHYGVDKDLLMAEQKIFSKFLETYNETSLSSAASIIQTISMRDLKNILPVFTEVAIILATIPATSCTAERSFSSLRRIKTYLRNRMGQERLNSLAILNIERKYTNMYVTQNINKIMDIFGEKGTRKSLFF